MCNLPATDKLEIEGKRVLIRVDFNVEDANNPRVESIRNIVNDLKSKGASKIKTIGHTETGFDIASVLRIEFPEVEFDAGLRNDPGEKANDMEFAKKLAEGWDIYINEAFSVSHREHASVMALPLQFKSVSKNVAAGPRFISEIENLGKIFDPSANSGLGPKSPIVMVISGLKEDKLSYMESFSKFADKILIGGRLPALLEINTNFQFQIPNEKIIVADLIQDKEDITIHSIEKFEKEIASAGTIVVSGPLGKFEDEGHRQGTERVFKAVVANTNAFKVAGGGDTEEAIRLLSLVDGFNWISVGGGAMLDFLAKGTLPGIEALRS